MASSITDYGGVTKCMTGLATLNRQKRLSTIAERLQPRYNRGSHRQSEWRPELWHRPGPGARAVRFGPLDPDGLGPDVPADAHGGLTVLPFSDPDDPPLPFDDPTQQRYEVIRPVVVIGNRTATERARETGMHPETVGRLKRRFEQQGMLGLIPETVEVVAARRQRRVPDEVIEELRRLKGLYDGFGYRELARIIGYKFNRRMSHATIQRLWPDLSPPLSQQLPLLDYHAYPERSQARFEVIQLFFQGWSKTSISIAR